MTDDTKALGEAIAHTYEVATSCDDPLCAAEHWQLMEWLRELYLSRQKDET